MFDDDASSEMESPLMFPGEEVIKRRQLKQYRISILILVILCVGLIVALVCSTVLGFGCHKPMKLVIHNPRPAFSFVHISDLHLDMYYKPNISKKTFCRQIDPRFKIPVETASYVAPYGRVGCDAPESLVRLAAQEAANLTKKNKDIKFMVLTGDQSAHRVENYFVSGTASDRVLAAMQKVKTILQTSIPEVPVIPAFGNNDLPGDYNLPPNSSFYANVLKIWRPLMLKECRGCTGKMVTSKGFTNTFLQGGYYKFLFQSSDQKIVILSLNTNYWSLKPYQPPRKPPSNAFVIADAQMKWLQEELEAAKEGKMKVVLAGHMPPGIDPYSGTAIWFQNYTKIYLKLVTSTHRDVVIAQLYGHFHKDEFKVQTNEEFDSKAEPSKINNFLLVAPGVTPVYSNNPSFRVVHVDKRDGRLMDYEQYYMDLVMATEFNATPWIFDYKFSEEYGLRPVADDMMTLSADLIKPTDKSVKWNKYVRHRQVYGSTDGPSQDVDIA